MLTLRLPPDHLAVDDARAAAAAGSVAAAVSLSRLVDAAVAVTVAANYAASPPPLFRPQWPSRRRLFHAARRRGESISKRGLREHGRDRSLVPGREVEIDIQGGRVFFKRALVRSLLAKKKKL